MRFPSILLATAVLIATSMLAGARAGEPGAPSRLDDVYAIYSFLLEYPGPAQIRFALRGQPVTFYDEVGVFYLVSDDIGARDSDEEPLMDCNPQHDLQLGLVIQARRSPAGRGTRGPRSGSRPGR